MYRRALPASAPTHFEASWTGLGLNLDPQELKLIRESIKYSFEYDSSYIEQQINAAALSRTLDLLKTGNPPDQNDLNIVLNLTDLADLNDYVSSHKLPLKLSLQDIFLLNEFIPWPPATKASLLENWLFTNRGPISTSATPEMKSRIISLVQDLHTACRQIQIESADPSQDHKPVWSDHILESTRIKATELMLFFKLNDIREYRGGGPSLDETQQETILTTLKELHEQHFILTPQALLLNPTAASRFPFEASPARIQALARIVSEQPASPPTNQLSLSETLWLLSIDPSRDQLNSYSYKYHKNDDISITQPMVQVILDRFGYAGGTEWLISHFNAHDVRDRLLMGLTEQMTEPQLNQMSEIVAHNVSRHALEEAQKTDNQFLFAKYAAAKKQANNLPSEVFEIAKGQRRHATDFPDLLKRRHDFATQSHTVDPAKRAEYAHRTTVSDTAYFFCFKGTEIQGFMARTLAKHDSFFLDTSVPLTQRANFLTNTVPYAIAPRDTYVEWMLQETVQLTDVHERLATAKQLLPLFTENSPYKQQYATRMLRDEISTNPDFYQSLQSTISTILQYMPEASLARNYFLDQVEEKCQVTPTDLDHLESLRLTDEGERKKSNSNTFSAEPAALVFDRLSEQNRLERSKSVLWIMGLNQDKPHVIDEIETAEEGSLEGLKALFAQSTPPEREIFFRRMFTGAEGVLDLAAVDNTLRQEASQQRHAFLDTLSKTFIPLDNATNDLFRNIFVTTLENAEPSHATQILTTILNEAIEANLSGRQLAPEAFLALSLNQLGVVGKKVSQSLAGMDWIPTTYRDEFQKSQEAAGVVPKRALKVFARSAGLLAQGAHLRITSFNQLLGSASNKQACLVTAEVNDPAIAQTLGVSPGSSISLVGKFKRPSVHKSLNLEHDLKLLDTVLDVLKQSNQAVNLPPGFSAQIRNAIIQELDFSKEKAFSDKLRKDINLRRTYEGYTVSIPTIAWLNQDQVYETEAKGSSLRKLVDAGKNDPDLLPEINRIKRVVFHEAVSELLNTGRIHADVHFGNCFADIASHNVELIDLGMNTEINPAEIIAVREILIGLVLGNNRIIDNAFKKFDWKLPATQFNRGRFGENTKHLLESSKQAQTPPPETVNMLLFSISKLPPLMEGLKTADILTVVKNVIPDKQLKSHAEILFLDRVASLLEHVARR
jgi:predicted unusual protein kinase regulating ubiquinone biosynthesis (AarF/ABC1/UbiB family)